MHEILDTSMDIFAFGSIVKKDFQTVLFSVKIKIKECLYPEKNVRLLFLTDFKSY